MRILRRLVAKLPPRPERRYDLPSEAMARPFAEPREAVREREQRAREQEARAGEPDDDARP